MSLAVEPFVSCYDIVACDRQSAEHSFAEILSLNAESVIEAGTVIFPGDAGGEFHQLCLIEVFAQAGKQGVRNFYWSLGHPIGVFQHEPLQPGEIQT